MLDQAAEMLPWFPRNATYHMELLASSVKGRDNLLQLIIPIMSRKADSINRTKPTSAMRVLPSELPCPVTTSTNSATSSHPTKSPAAINTKSKNPRKNRERKTNTIDPPNLSEFLFRRLERLLREYGNIYPRSAPCRFRLSDSPTRRISVVNAVRYVVKNIIAERP